MEDFSPIQWSALEYEERERTRDWFWALGIIIVTASVASIIFGNYFFAALIILGGTLLGFFAIRKPEMVTYEINDRGLKVRTRIYPYENIKSFWVMVEKKPTLFIKSERVFMPIISMPIDPAMAEDIRNVMLFQNVPEEEMREHASEKIMESLGF
ncbi:MAG: hypothetical protein AAB815_03005 [Patescibacteria group bacterium]